MYVRINKCMSKCVYNWVKKGGAVPTIICSTKPCGQGLIGQLGSGGGGPKNFYFLASYLA